MPGNRRGRAIGPGKCGGRVSDEVGRTGQKSLAGAQNQPPPRCPLPPRTAPRMRGFRIFPAPRLDVVPARARSSSRHGGSASSPPACMERPLPAAGLRMLSMAKGSCRGRGCASSACSRRLMPGSEGLPPSPAMRPGFARGRPKLQAAEPPPVSRRLRPAGADHSEGTKLSSPAGREPGQRRTGGSCRAGASGAGGSPDWLPRRERRGRGQAGEGRDGRESRLREGRERVGGTCPRGRGSRKKYKGRQKRHRAYLSGGRPSPQVLHLGLCLTSKKNHRTVHTNAPPAAKIASLLMLLYVLIVYNKALPVC